MNACTHCKRLTTKDVCDVCNNPATHSRMGLILDISPIPFASGNEDLTAMAYASFIAELAKELNIELPGEYCLIVR